MKTVQTIQQTSKKYKAGSALGVFLILVGAGLVVPYPASGAAVILLGFSIAAWAKVMTWWNHS